MELKQFVAETLTQILDGVGDAQAVRQSKKGKIAPPINYAGEYGKRLAEMDMLKGQENQPVDFVEFDVAVTVDDQQEKGVK